jgi:hypothetical protein
MYPILMSQPEDPPDYDPASGPFSYLSFQTREELHPYGNPPGIGPATDPLLQFMLPYFKPPDLLVIGRLYCSNDHKGYFQMTRPYFMKLRAWIRKNWKKLPTRQYIGPEAEALVEQGARLAYFPPGVVVEKRYI